MGLYITDNCSGDPAYGEPDASCAAYITVAGILQLNPDGDPLPPDSYNDKVNSLMYGCPS